MRRLGTVGGNLGIAIQHTGFASDIVIVLLGMNASVEIAGNSPTLANVQPFFFFWKKKEIKRETKMDAGFDGRRYSKRIYEHCSALKAFQQLGLISARV